jgi:hypothetical protein
MRAAVRNGDVMLLSSLLQRNADVSALPFVINPFCVA